MNKLQHLQFLGRLGNQGGEKPAWTPAKLGNSLTAWFDASNSNSISTVANPFTALIVIGDSWSDGKAWPQAACTALSIPFSSANNFAKSGANVIGSGPNNGNGQIDAVIAAQGGTLNPNHLYAYFLSGNDIIEQSTAASIAAEMKIQLQRLITAGARWIIVQNQKTWKNFIPAFLNNPSYNYIDTISLDLSTRLQVIIKELQDTTPDVVFFQQSNGDFLATVALNPSAYGSVGSASDPTGLFAGADSLHMNVNGYTRMGEWVANVTVKPQTRARVTEWRDISGKNNHLSQSNTTLQPIFVNQGSPQGYVLNNFQQNFLPAIRLRGTDFLRCNSLGSRNGVTCYVVVKLRQNPGGFRQTICGEWTSGVFSGQNSWVLTGGVPFNINEGNVARPGGSVEIGSPGGFGQPAVRNATDVVNSYYILGLRHDLSTLQTRLNGINIGSVAAVGNLNNISSLNFFVGTIAYNSADYTAPIDICEIIVSLSALNDLQKLEGYLAWKWKMQSNLPIDHPYRWNGREFGYTSSEITDSDAQTYIAAVEAADGQELEISVKYAITNFIIRAKADGIWDAIKSSNILAGARTLNGALVPLKGTAPTNFNFVSGDYNRKTGLIGNGNTKYLDTNRNNNADPQNNNHNAVFITTASNIAGVSAYMATSAGHAGSNNLAVNTTTNEVFCRSRSASASVISNAARIGFAGFTRSVSAQYDFRISGNTTTNSIVSDVPVADPISLFRRGTSNYSNGRLSFYSIGESLNLALLDARVTQLMTDLGNAIP